MGDPRRTRKNYAKPRILWNEEMLAEDKQISKEYSTRNKKEIWKMAAFLANIKDQAKSITSRLGTARKEQALREQEQLIAKIQRYGLIRKDEVTLSDLLSLGIRDVMDRRLQTLVFKKQLARTVSQARQFVVHGHIRVGGKKVTSPSYMVPVSEEDSIEFVDRSPMKDPQHPERGDVDPHIIIKQREEEKKQAEEAAKAAEAEAAAAKEQEAAPPSEGPAEESVEATEKSSDESTEKAE